MQVRQVYTVQKEVGAAFMNHDCRSDVWRLFALKGTANYQSIKVCSKIVMLTKFAILMNLYLQKELQCFPPKNTLIFALFLVHKSSQLLSRATTEFSKLSTLPRLQSEEGKSLHFLTPILSRSCFASGIEANYIYSMIWHDLGIIFIPTRFDIRMRLNWNLSVCRPLWW